MDSELWTLLTGSAAVNAVCGQRIYWGDIPQDADAPAAVLTIISGADEPHLRGTDALWRYRVQIDCYGVNRVQARALSAAIVGTLNGHGLSNETGIRGAFVDSTREFKEDAANARPSRISHDFIINWRTP